MTSNTETESYTPVGQIPARVGYNLGEGWKGYAKDVVVVDDEDNRGELPKLWGELHFNDDTRCWFVRRENGIVDLYPGNWGGNTFNHYLATEQFLGVKCSSSLAAMESRLRRMAKREGLRIQKQRKIAPYTEEYGRYLINDEDNHLVAGANTLEGLEELLSERGEDCG
jgi:hypothetical protein